jgi:hypothetical protein
LEILGKQSDNPDSTVDSSRGTETPAKEDKIMLTEKEEKFTTKFQSVVSKNDKVWKITLRHVSDRGPGKRKEQENMM